MASKHTAAGLEADLDFVQIDLPPNLPITGGSKQHVKRCIQEGSNGRIAILITGTSGVGKSTLINALLGKPVRKASNELLVRPNNVSEYAVTVEGMEIVIWDSPGLQDGSRNEEEYLAELKEKCTNVNIVIYCISLSSTRSELASVEMVQNDISAIEKLTTAFGTNWWGHSIFVMTFANALETRLRVKSDLQKNFYDRLNDWKVRIHGALSAAGVPKEVAEKVPVVPAGHAKKPHLPGQDNWVSELWLTIAHRVTAGKLPHLKYENQDNEIASAMDYTRGSNLAGVVSRVGIPVAIGFGIGAAIGLTGGVAGVAVGSFSGGGLGFAAGLFLHQKHRETKYY